MLRIPTHGPPNHPGMMLREEFLKPLGMTQSALANLIGVPYRRVNELINGRRGMTPDTALRLERLFGMEAQFWLNLQLGWDLYQAQHSQAAQEIAQIQRLPALIQWNTHNLRVANAITQCTMEDTDAGQNVVSCESTEDMFARLGI
jgi:antitoxin HigA-1